MLPNVPGFLVQAGFVEADSVADVWEQVYTYAWFVGFLVSGAVHTIGMLTTPSHRRS